MAYYLENAYRSFPLSIFRYHNFLDFAVLYGWVPMGTVKTEVSEWSGKYHSNGDQQVTGDDARNMAAALRKGLKDIPDVDAPAEPERHFTDFKQVTDLLDRAFEFNLSWDRKSELLRFYCDREEKERLLKFVEFITEDEEGYNTGC